MTYYKFIITNLDTNEKNEVIINSENTTFIHRFPGLNNTDGTFKISFTEKLRNLDTQEGLAQIATLINNYLNASMSIEIALFNADDIENKENVELMYNIGTINPINHFTFQGRQNDPFGKEKEALPFARDLEIG